MAVVQSRFVVINEVSRGAKDNWRLCLQWGRYNYVDGTTELGYRFIWRDEKNRLHPQRGQACIHSLKIAEQLMDEARKAGWGNHVGGKK